ncbi:hypothetical protein U9M48_002613 [Paspalum notatum var. saurae]|uniref:DUF4378 domain-containing protein n=1 Tax=Paspalum notatum var. saurae TaxID=547442 RepID=A0AAQ3SJY6_PASNO
MASLPSTVHPRPTTSVHCRFGCLPLRSPGFIRWAAPSAPGLFLELVVASQPLRSGSSFRSGSVPLRLALPAWPSDSCFRSGSPSVPQSHTPVFVAEPYSHRRPMCRAPILPPHGIQSARTPAQQAAAAAHRHPLPSNITTLKLPHHQKYTNPVAKLPRLGSRLYPDAVHESLVRHQELAQHDVTRLPIRFHEYESILASDHTDGTKSGKGLNEVEQPSPVSILDPPTDEDSCFSGCFKYDLQDMAKKRRDGHQHHDEPEVSLSSDDEDHSAYQFLEAFQVEEDRDFSYLLDILICSGIIIADLQLICKSWYSPGCPVGPHVFDRLERKYNKIITWAKPERRLLFDLVNSILSEVLAPCVDVHPWVQPSRHCVPLWGPEGPVEKVWQTIVRQRENSVTGHPDEMVLDAKWLEVSDNINMVGKQVARMLHGDLLEEVIVDFL